jgi:hypothetical protein
VNAERKLPTQIGILRTTTVQYGTVDQLHRQGLRSFYQSRVSVIPPLLTRLNFLGSFFVFLARIMRRSCYAANYHENDLVFALFEATSP